MKLLSLVPFLGLTYAATQDNITVTCEADNTISVNIEYDSEATILELEYGSCNERSAGVKGADEQNADNGWDLTFNVTACDMDSKLRTLEYNQTASIRVGRASQGMELTMANFEIDSFCEYTATYTVTFDYGSLSTEAHSFTESGGLIGLNIVIQSYDSLFFASSSASSQGGETIYLGMTITNEGVVYANDTAGTDGKQFAPLSCAVNDTKNDIQYTLFDADSGDCTNTDVDLTIDYNSSTHMWQFSHTLFLLDNHRSSSFELICEVIVCESGDDNTACDDIKDKCLTGSCKDQEAVAAKYHPDGTCKGIASHTEEKSSCSGTKSSYTDEFSGWYDISFYTDYNTWSDVCGCECADEPASEEDGDDDSNNTECTPVPDWMITHDAGYGDTDYTCAEWWDSYGPSHQANCNSNAWDMGNWKDSCCFILYQPHC